MKHDLSQDAFGTVDESKGCSLRFVSAQDVLCSNEKRDKSRQAASVVVQYIDGQPERMREDFNHFAVEALQANWPCSIEAGARDTLAVVLH